MELMDFKWVKIGQLKTFGYKNKFTHAS